MRLLIYDDTPVGHHPFYMRHTVAAARSLRRNHQVLYCYPTELGVEGVEYLPLPRSHWTRALRLCDRRLRTKLLVRYKWRLLDRLARLTRADRVLLMDASEFLKPGVVPNVAWDWVPLYMHPRGTRRPGERLPVEPLRSHRCRFVYTLDEGVTNKLVAALGKEVRHFPDLAEADEDLDSPLVAAARQRAEGRPIISALGTVTHHKNTKLLLEVARLRQDWFFVVAGTVNWNRLSQPESILLREAVSWPNVLVHATSISDGTLNALTSHSGVLYGCYLDFPHSSNKLTKACLFRVPVVAADGDYMGEVVREYRIGTVCDPSKTDALESSIATLLATGPTDPRWDAYLQRNSVDSLYDSLAWLFQ
jgi:glycosyltransferase involved in cell wall biosynthesis